MRNSTTWADAADHPIGVAASSVEFPSDRVADPGRHSAKPLHGVVPVSGGIEPHGVRFLQWLGAGRAAQVRLVEVTLPKREPLVCVEKVFRPALLTRLIYRAAFQAPFAYQWNEHAIRACFYRRRVFGAITSAMVSGVRVAEPLYVRWDDQAEAFVLGSEFIRGRGIVPAPPDSHTLRRAIAQLFGRSEICPPPPAEEIAQLLETMTELENLLGTCGLVGSGWQVCKRAMVSTANLLRTPDGYVVVDLESGIPAVLVPKYIGAGFRLGSFPLFDDVDSSRLRNWLARHRSELTKKLGRVRLSLLENDSEQLIEQTKAWKLSEPAVGRNLLRLGSGVFRDHFKARCLDTWRRRDIIDADTENAIQPGRRLVSRLTFWLGLVPGPAGRLLQRLWANRPYRAKLSRFVKDAQYRREQLIHYMARKAHEWSESGRIAPDRQFATTGPFLLNALLARTTPRALHRWLSDPIHRRNILSRMMLICVSSRFQSEYGRHLIRSSIRAWERAERLGRDEAALLHRQLDSDDLDEYVRCFGLHFGLKLLLPLMAPLKFSGAAASLASGNPLYFLVLLLLLPACRTAITVWRMLASKRPLADYLDALLVGALPVVGTLAYPVQMYSKQRELSAFILRDRAGWLGRWLPIYGGKDSRVEIAAIRCVNWILESLEIGLAGTAPLRRRVGQGGPVRALAQFAPSRWDGLVEEQLRLLESDGELPLERTPDSTSAPAIVPPSEARAA